MLLTVTPAQIFGCTTGLVKAHGVHGGSNAGSVDNHLVEIPDNWGIKVHQAVIDPLKQLQAAAQQAGFQLKVVSGFRSFERQLLIWNKKCCGQRPVLDDCGREIDIHRLSAEDKVNAICRWSALPGASRHHWGTECDIYDAAAVPEDYQLQLHPDEYNGQGPFAPMMVWLDEYLQQVSAPKFYRPYLVDYSGVAPEPWHISYQPVAEVFEKYFSLSGLKALLQQSNIEEKSVLIAQLDKIYQRFIQLPHSNYPVDDSV